MTRRAALFVVALVGAALIGVALFALPGSPLQQKPTLGLDLQGGLEVTLQAVPPRDRELTEDDLNRSVEIMRDRVDKLGTTEPEIRTQGDDQISIQLPGVKNPEAAAEIIGKTAQLELFDLEANLVAPSIDARTRQPIATPKLYDLLAGQQALAARGEPETYYVFRTKGKKLVAGPVQSKEAALSKWDGKLPAGHKLFAVPPQTVVVSCGIGEEVCPGVPEQEPTRNYHYLLRFTPPDVPEMTGKDLDLDGTRQDFDTRTGEPIVLMDFTDSGAEKFEDITREVAQRGKLLFNSVGGGQGDYRNWLQHFAIVLDREMKSWPTIDFEEYPGGITGSNGAQISGLGSIDEAKNLALVLQTGALPVEFRTLDQTAISATLGEDSLREALRAAIGGLILVAAFLLIAYRSLGLVAVLGLAMNAVFLYGAILLFNVTLTLPGFAGLILAIGVAADANIVIFERIKEEAAAGRSVRSAVFTGYSKGFATIVDANVVTAITALVLFAVATAGVRGFAFMLLLGTGVSLLTAVFATRALLVMLARFNWFENARFMGTTPQRIPTWLKIDFVGKRRIWFTIAGIAIAISIGSIVFKGLNLGIDFDGGSQLGFTTQQAQTVSTVRDELGQLGLADATIVGRGDEAPGGGFREFSVRTEELTTTEQRQIQTALGSELGATFTGTRNVSASFSEQILRSAILAMIVSFLLITLYISIRFQWRFAVPILRTIVNDGVIALGVYSLSGREVSAATVAAFLTIIGYSIYDTIIVFDRVRENLPVMRHATIAQIINQSVWETVRRSLATTFITLLPVGALFFFGGDTLKDFAFAILVGIGISAFSTLFIAAPFLAVLLERAPEYRRQAGMQRAAEERGKPPATAPEPVEPALGAAAVVAAGSSAPADAPLSPADAAKRERRRQRRSTRRPHGRAR
jgi:SecD/SecF fusion protein